MERCVQAAEEALKGWEDKVEAASNFGSMRRQYGTEYPEKSGVEHGRMFVFGPSFDVDCFGGDGRE